MDEGDLSAKQSHESQRMLATLLGNLPGMAYRCRNDPDWTMEFVSNGCSPLTGYPPEALMGNRQVSYAQLIHPNDRTQVWEDVQAALRERKPFRFIYRITTATGTEKWVWEQGCGIFDDQGKLLFLEGFITDITDQRQTERFKEQFVHVLSHELRSPMTSLQEGARLFAEGQLGSLTVEQQDYFSTMLADLERLIVLINKVSAAHQLLAGDVEFVREPVAVTNVLREIEADRRLYAQAHALTLQNTTDPLMEQVTVIGDAKWLTKVVDEVVENAIDASPEGDVVCLSCQRSGTNIELSIQDHGCGIPHEEIPRVFQPFYLVGDPDERKKGGVGLGLFIAARVIDGLGGSISLDSEVGKGTVARISLPAMKQQVE